MVASRQYDLGSMESRAMNAETILHISWGIAAATLWFKRTEIGATLKRLPWRWRFAIGALLVACAFIPGPADDFIVMALVARLGR